MRHRSHFLRHDFGAHSDDRLPVCCTSLPMIFVVKIILETYVYEIIRG